MSLLRASTFSRPKERTRSGGRRGGFTLLEVLLVLALLGLLGAVLITGAIHLTDEKPKAAYDVFWQAVLAARKQALVSGREVRMRFTAGKEKDKDRAFVISSEATGMTERFPIEEVGELTVDFLAQQKSNSSILIGGQVVDTQTLPYVTFYGDGTCSTFRLQVRNAGGTDVIAIDPWTCAEVLNTGERKAGGG